MGQTSRLVLTGMVGQASHLAAGRSPGLSQSRLAGPAPPGRPHPNPPPALLLVAPARRLALAWTVGPCVRRAPGRSPAWRMCSAPRCPRHARQMHNVSRRIPSRHHFATFGDKAIRRCPCTAWGCEVTSPLRHFCDTTHDTQGRSEATARCRSRVPRRRPAHLRRLNLGHGATAWAGIPGPKNRSRGPQGVARHERPSDPLTSLWSLFAPPVPPHTPPAAWQVRQARLRRDARAPSRGRHLGIPPNGAAEKRSS